METVASTGPSCTAAYNVKYDCVSNDQMTTVPVALFTFNRPNHLLRVLRALQKNQIEILYIFSDGYDGKENEAKVQAVREIISNIDWCRTKVKLSDNNRGLADSIIDGVQTVFSDHQRIIVLEDDCVPSCNFVSFMERFLDHYAHNAQVMNINGYAPDVQIPRNFSDDIYFTHRSSSWGWATWKSAWENFEREPMTYNELVKNETRIRSITDKAGIDLFPMMKSQLAGDIDSWSIWWSYAIAANGGLCLNPVSSKIKNIGNDGSGTHTGDTDHYDVGLDDTPVSNLAVPTQPFVNVKLNKRYNNEIIAKRSLIFRIVSKVLRRFEFSLNL